LILAPHRLKSAHAHEALKHILLEGIVLLFVGGCLTLLLFAVWRYGILLPRVSGIPVLMYHIFCAGPQTRDRMTVHAADFSKQIEWLRNNGYQTLTLNQFLQHVEGKLERSQLPKKPILITVDDGYRSTFDIALPILKKNEFTAIAFIATHLVPANANDDTFVMAKEHLQAWVQAGMDIALHSHAHQNYRKITADAALEDLRIAEQLLSEWQVPFHPVIAYPFGALPRKQHPRTALIEALKLHGIRAGFRIGNRIQPFVTRRTQPNRRFAMLRVGIRGDESFFEFKTKVRKGRTKQF